MAQSYLVNFAISLSIGFSTLIVLLDGTKRGYLKLTLRYNSPPVFSKSKGFKPFNRAVQLKVFFNGSDDSSSLLSSISHSIPYAVHDQNVSQDAGNVKISARKVGVRLMTDFHAQCLMVKERDSSPSEDYSATIPNISLVQPAFRHKGQTFQLSFEGGCRWIFELDTICDDDWYGLHCDTFCLENGISISQCLPDGSKVCHQGFHGPDCADINECLDPGPDPCIVYQNASMCHNTMGSYICICFPGYQAVGHTCLDIDECSITNNNICMSGTCTNTQGSFHCECPKQYTGMYCEEDVNACDQAVCENGGTCYNSKGSFQCICPLYSTGTHCQISFDPCRDDHCGDNGICNGFGPKWNCTCDNGFYGTTCKETHSSDQCGRNYTCQNGGECIGLKRRSPKCYCSPLHTGEFCELRNPDARPKVAPLLPMAEKESFAVIGIVRASFVIIFFTSAGVVVSIVYSNVHTTYRKLS